MNKEANTIIRLLKVMSNNRYTYILNQKDHSKSRVVCSVTNTVVIISCELYWKVQDSIYGYKGRR